VKMQSWNSKLDEIFALTGRILNPHLDRCILIALNPHELALQFRRNLGTAQRGETAHLWRGENRQNSRYDWHRHAHGPEIVDEAVIILVIEKKLRNDRCGAGVDFLLQKIQIGSAAVGPWMDFRKAGHPD